MARFTVDTHLFRELGELLVGRDSTALIELIKNSYDADATEVTVYGEHLSDQQQGRIVVMDNGTGMTRDQFTSGFLRIASRLKDQGVKRSAVFERRYTGVKGIGRLAAHKLARRLEVSSVHRGDSRGVDVTELRAVLDWDAIEKYETLDRIPDHVVSLSESGVENNAATGTTLTLSSLRRPWTPKERARFFAEVQAFQTPEFLSRPLASVVVPEPVLFDRPLIRDIGSNGAGRADEGFKVDLTGEFESGHEYWDIIAEMAAWVLEIRAEAGSARVRFAVAPTRRTRVDNPDARGHAMAIAHPEPEGGLSFDARILVREGRIKGKGALQRRSWAAQASGIRVYLEGFRVLPYGDDDWLSIDADYTSRARQLDMLKDMPLAGEFDGEDPDKGLTRLRHTNYFGGVLLTHERAPTLRVLVNREGFVPEAAFGTLRRLVRTGVDLCTRVRAASNLKRRLRRRESRREAHDGTTTEDRHPLPDLTEAAQMSIREAQRLVIQNDHDAAQAKMRDALHAIEEVRSRAERVVHEGSLFHVLASVGTQMTAFAHEMNALLGAAQILREGLESLLGDSSFQPVQRRRIRRVWAAAVDLAQRIERHASYLVDVVTPDARRRRSRQPLADRFDAAVQLVRRPAERRGIRIENHIGTGLRTPPMFPAELTSIFSNLLTNATKNAGKDGRIFASAASDSQSLRVRVQNTGVAVELGEAERWFEPFQSTTEEVSPVLGQGMGLGLTITRRMLDYYGIQIRFVDPDPPYATAIEMVFPQ